jgi:stage III sporulation protein AA
LLSSGGHPLKFKGFKIGLVDERSEIGASLDGVPQNDLGLRTDVLDACPKAEGMMMLVRSMSPDIIATDEIGSLADTRAILEAVHSGVAILTTAHAGTIEDIHYRSQLKELFDERVFERYILLSQRRGSGTIEGIYNRESKLMSSLKEASICLTS